MELSKCCNADIEQEALHPHKVYCSECGKEHGVVDSSLIGPPKSALPVGTGQLKEFRQILKMLEDKFEAGVEENEDGFTRCDKTKSKYTIHSFDIHIEINTEGD